MSNKSHKSIFIIIITLLYCIYFYFNCIIIPYTAVYDNYIIYYDKEKISGCRVYPVGAQEEPAEAPVRAVSGRDAQYTGYVDSLFGHAAENAPETGSFRTNNTPASTYGPGQNAPYLPGSSAPYLPDSAEHPAQVLPGIYGETVRDGPENSKQDTQLPPSGTGQESRPVSGSAGQNDSRVLLSGSRTVKVLSSLSLKDKFWLVELLSRCSMEELLLIKTLLKDGVTYRENLEMYRMLREKVTDDEQKKLDALIEAHTR